MRIASPGLIGAAASLSALSLLAYTMAVPVAAQAPKAPGEGFDSQIGANSAAMLAEGRKIFRYDTFGDEAFWGGALHLHEAIAGAKNGGVGPGVSPKTALKLGLKVDSEALPPALVDALKAGKVDLDDPATTLALLEANAVVGVTGKFDQGGKLTSMGI